jgi:hypothetical protein
MGAAGGSGVWPLIMNRAVDCHRFSAQSAGAASLIPLRSAAVTARARASATSAQGTCRASGSASGAPPVAQGDHPTSHDRRRLKRSRWSLLASSPATTGPLRGRGGRAVRLRRLCALPRARTASAASSRLKRKGSLCVRSLADSFTPCLALVAGWLLRACPE